MLLSRAKSCLPLSDARASDVCESSAPPTPYPAWPQDVLRGAAEEVLAALKNDKLKDPERQAEVRYRNGAQQGP